MTYKEFLRSNGEKKWQDEWLSKKIDKAEDFSDRPKKYVLDMFPYPSGAGLHVGHPEGYTATDIYSRYWRLKGFNVLHPMGWDAFGLPAENYAIKTGTQPQATTEANIATFKRQIQALGFSYDWDREIDTTDPNYYKWTQWIFLQLFKQGLAYEATVPINFCPSCKTGLANEEVRDGECERCGSAVERKDMRQWLLRITAYADRLLAGLDNLDWPESIKTLQRNWIGRSEGAEVTFNVIASDRRERGNPAAIEIDTGSPRSLRSLGMTITVYTTRPDTLFGATYMVLSPEHKLIQDLKEQITNFSEVENYIKEAKNKSDLERTELNKDKSGVELKGIKAINPVSNQEIPIWISDYVLISYGTGAIMAVPAHDTRDWEFAVKFDLPVIQVIAREPEKFRSYLMGADDIGDDDLSALGIEIVEKQAGGSRKILIPKNAKADYEKLITNKLTPGFWNEYVGDKIVFIFKFKTGEVKRFELGLDNSDEIDRLAAEFVGEDWGNKKSVWKWLATEVEFYRDLIIHEEINEGRMINSGFLDGILPAQAIGKMTAWLEQRGLGKKAVNYKLRDWVFSRQRYWGEPMPIVFCDNCKDKKQKVLLIHGFEGSGEGNWFPWIKEQFEKAGLEVFNPTISTSAHPEVENWLEELMPYMDQLGNNDIIIGHSLGAKAALLLLQQAKKKIGHVFLVAPALNSFTDKEYERFSEEWGGADIEKLKIFINTEINWQQIDALADDKQAIYSDNDPVIKTADAEFLPFGWSRQVWTGFNHFEEKEIDELWPLFRRAKNTGWVALPENELPLQLPEVAKYEPTGTGESPLANIKEWVETKCPVCGGPARRETNTMPQWAGSSWYWLRYLDPHNDRELAARDKLSYWLPVDVYLGGAEHAVLHLLYARFWNLVLYDLGAVPQAEPFAKLVNQGLILGEDGEKMSKSRGNVINPDDILAVHGADAFRMYEMFMGPLEQMKPWSTQGIVGIDRFLEKVWNLFSSPYQGEAKEGLPKVSENNGKPPLTPPWKGGGNSDLDILLNKTIKKVGEDIEKMSFNTAISAMMILINKFNEAEQVNQEDLEKFLIILSPLAPHLAEELWSRMGNIESVFKQSWPSYDKDKIKNETVEIAIQINGKVRGKIKVALEIEETAAMELAKQDANVAKYLTGQKIKKTIYVKGKLISFVI